MNGAGKGDRPRPFNRKRWDEGYDRAFGPWQNAGPPKDEAEAELYDHLRDAAVDIIGKNR